MSLRCNGRAVIQKARTAGSAWKRFRGLMFEKEANFDYALVFELPRETRLGASVHMMFVFFPIGIVFLDSKKRVVDKASLKPWALNYTPKKAAKYFVELPLKKAEGIKEGNEIHWD